MGVIFWASADSGSGHRSSRIFGPLLRWFVPEASPQKIEELIFLIRKVAHVSEYAVLAWLAWRVFLVFRLPPDGTRPLRAALWAWGLSVLYAATDEWHQTFVPTRMGTPVDVLIDAGGAALGLCLVGLWWRWRRASR